MNTARICKQCGVELPLDSSESLCSVCAAKRPGRTIKLDIPAISGGSLPVSDLPPAAWRVQHGVRSAKPSISSAGQQFGEYRIVRELGAGVGGMGEVYEAERLQDGQVVALKVLQQKLDSPDDRERFLREGRTAAKVNHPNAVYIYGSEEINGQPVITMELVRGGSLQDRINWNGPLPVKEAVEAVLQIIEGLEAVHEAGILHRDIKPANCFVERDGTVKVGDFGIAIPATARSPDDTVEDKVFYSPGYSSPEQMRGENLDVRSDIFSVGATLYCLLIGNAPFKVSPEARNDPSQFCSSLCQAIKQGPKPPQQSRRGIPAGLAAVVLRCLQAQPKKRFSTYSELRRVLVPFAWKLEFGEEDMPFGLLRRFCAILIDCAVLFVLFGIGWHYAMAFLNFDAKPHDKLWLHLGVFFSTMLYFTVLEGRWGVSVGKWLCRLRLVTSKWTRVGFLRAWCRYMLCCAVPLAIVLVVQSGKPPSGSSEAPRAVVRSSWLAEGGQAMDIVVNARFDRAWRSIDGVRRFLRSGRPPQWHHLLREDFRESLVRNRVEITVTCLWVVALFSFTARRDNGFQGIHDLLSGTAVIVRVGPHDLRSRLAGPKQAVQLPVAADAPRIGPYCVLKSLKRVFGEELLLGYDENLRRHVWIKKLTPGHPPVPATRRRIKRRGRLRWLDGKRSQDECWDAYDAPEGKALLLLLSERQPWRTVRWWLLDLAEELAAASKERSHLTSLGLDRIWITMDGRAVLLEFPAPGTMTQAVDTFLPSLDNENLAGGQFFLLKVSVCALAGRVVADIRPQALPAKLQITEDVRLFLKEMHTFPNWSSLVEKIREFVPS